MGAGWGWGLGELNKKQYRRGPYKIGRLGNFCLINLMKQSNNKSIKVFFSSYK